MICPMYAAPVRKDECIGCQCSKQGLCDYPYKNDMSLEEIREVTQSD